MTTPVNVLLTDASDIYGGGEFFVFELAGALMKRGHRVTVSCRGDNLLAEKCAQEKIPIFPVMYPANGRLTRTIMMLKNFIDEHRVDIIHTNNNYDRTAGAIAARLAGSRHVTNVHSFHSIQHNLTHWMRNRAWTDKFLVDGYCVRDLLVDEDGIPASKISVIHLGVDPSMMRNNPGGRERVRKEFRIANDELVIGNVGRLVPMKGQEFLLRAFVQLARPFGAGPKGAGPPGAKLLLVGDGELMEKLRTIAKEGGAEERVIFAGFRDDLVDVYSAFDIYAHSSIEGAGETFPFAVLQALAQELPAVVTDVGDVAEMVEHGKNGFVVPEKNPDALAGALAAVLQETDIRQRMSSESSARFHRLFTLDTMVARIEEVYASLFPAPSSFSRKQS